MVEELMKRFMVLAAVAVFGAAAAGSANAATVTRYDVQYDTGVLDWTANFNPDGVTTSPSTIYNVPLYNPGTGGSGGTVGFWFSEGYPFDATFSVDAYTNSPDDQIVMSETVSGAIKMLVNGNVYATDPLGTLTLSNTCAGGTSPGSDVLCNAEQKEFYFSQTVPVVLPQGAVVDFVQELDITNSSCSVNYAAGGSGLCVNDGTSITELGTSMSDPQYENRLSLDYVPEPASASILGVAVAGLVAARRRRRLNAGGRAV
jgi:hypothetical protein